MPQTKDKDLLNGYKHMTLIYVVYKRPTSNKAHIQTESEGDRKSVV